MKNDRFLKNQSPQIALTSHEKTLSRKLAELDILPDYFHLYIRAFKAEQELELWVRPTSASNWQVFKSYPFCKSSGSLGPKRREGDRQIPEGIYFIDRFNPKSKYHLSLGLNYPNLSDRIMGNPKEPGSDIFIHGGCETVGCIPISDDGIEEVYVLAMWAVRNGQLEIPVHIFPYRFTAENVHSFGSEFPQHRPFWQQLESIYLEFEKEKKLPAIRITREGNYEIY